MEKLRVFVAADGITANYLTEALTAYGGVDVASGDKTTHYAAEEYAGRVIALEYDGDDNALAHYVGEGAVVVALCGDVAEGFSVLNKGAREMLALPSHAEMLRADYMARDMFAHSLVLKIRSAASKRSDDERYMKRECGELIGKIIAVGSSTGGTEALVEIIKRLPADCPPALIVQHMPPVFTRMYAQRLHNTYLPSTWEARDGDRLKRGLVLIAPGDKHMTLARDNHGYYVRCEAGEKVNGHCPSVDVLFDSIVELGASRNTVAAILTGMGSDGARGLKRLRDAGTYTIGQDEASCVVYGMPKAAFDMGAVSMQEDIKNIAIQLLSKSV